MPVEQHLQRGMRGDACGAGAAAFVRPERVGTCSHGGGVSNVQTYPKAVNENHRVEYAARIERRAARPLGARRAPVPLVAAADAGGDAGEAAVGGAAEIGARAVVAVRLRVEVRRVGVGAAAHSLAHLPSSTTALASKLTIVASVQPAGKFSRSEKMPARPVARPFLSSVGRRCRGARCRRRRRRRRVALSTVASSAVVREQRVEEVVGGLRRQRRAAVVAVGAAEGSSASVVAFAVSSSRACRPGPELGHCHGSSPQKSEMPLTISKVSLWSMHSGTVDVLAFDTPRFPARSARRPLPLLEPLGLMAQQLQRAARNVIMLGSEVDDLATPVNAGGARCDGTSTAGVTACWYPPRR